MTKIINLYGGPGTGKSTTAALLYGEMKQKGINCELVTEYAKDVVWWEAEAKLKNQIYVFAKQHSRIFRLLDKVDYIITDSPLLLSCFYGRHESEEFHNLIKHEVNSHDNIHIFLNRCKKYNPIGRMQTEDEARYIDIQIISMLQGNDIDFSIFDAGKGVVSTIMNKVLKGTVYEES